MEENPTMMVVAAALVGADGRVLLQQRSAHRSMAGLWEFPGGKVEAGETPEEALVRELREELGIEVDVADLIPTTFVTGLVTERRLLLLLYLSRRWSGEPQPLDAAGLEWVRPVDMHRLPMPPADEPLIPIVDLLIGGS